MKQVTLHEIMTIEDTSDILDHFSIDEIDEVSKDEILEFLLDTFGEPDLEECDKEEFDLIEDDRFLNHRVNEDDEDSGYLLKITNDSVIWSHFSIEDN